MAEPNSTQGAQFDQNRLKVRLVTPERILVETDAASVTMPGQTGVLEALPGAAPLLTALGAGECLIAGGDGPGGVQRFILARGFAEILPDRVTILAEYAELPDAVDKAAAEQQLKQGQKQVEEAGQDPTLYDAARQIVQEAEAKLSS